MKRLSIKARVTFWYTLLVALIALLAAGALFWSAQRMMDNYYEEALVGTTQLALNDVRMEDGAAGDRPQSGRPAQRARFALHAVGRPHLRQVAL